LAEERARLELRGIAKAFPGVQALRGVDFDVRAGEVHALLGENGAGKSTLIKVLTGVHPADAGTFRLDGQDIRPANPSDAVRHGISTVYQEVNLAPNLTVAENVCLGREPRKPWGLDWSAMANRAEKALARIGVQIDVRRRLSRYSIANQQMVAIARALDVDAKILVLDEPTSSLDASEVDQLFAAMRRLKAEGLGIVFVTHFLDQVYAISDRITILRNGERVGTFDADLPRQELIGHMIGRSADALEPGDQSAHEQAGPPILTGHQLGKRGSVEGVDFELGSGEVLGFAGLLGSGRTETVRLLFGIDQPTTGQLSLDGSQRRKWNPRTAVREGFGLCAEDRKAEGIFPGLTVRENILIVQQVKAGWLRRVSPRKQREQTQIWGEQVKLQPPDPERLIENLSGGNQQKALIARWLAVSPRLLLLDEPTRGIDVGAKFEIMTIVERLRAEGKSFVFVSSELAEVVRVSSRIAVFRDRRIVATLPRDQANEEAIVSAIAQPS
jgi:galactofuranose transport system ATP-binding protein